ncbi:MAG TPA: Xaa-Pro peptidase family protein [Verrucomicrobiae bacterium]|jgi:Xaa-Pro aminopeptidase|nr:Xaa-Pro peptidase family protein [Verrucomicrobiae bacterium]
MNYTVRQEKIAAEMRRAGVEALLVTHLPNIRYLCGFTGTSGALLMGVGVRPCGSVFFTDGRYTQQAEAEVRGAKVVVSRQPAWMAACARAQKANIARLGFEAEHVSYGVYHQFKRFTRDTMRLKALDGLAERLRETKDLEEIEQIRAAVVLASSLFQSALSVIRPGVSETSVAGELEMQARAAGAEKMSFDTIVAAGLRSALPHGRASSQGIPVSGFIILDYGVILAGYCSDMTRTVHMGPVSQTHRRMYQAVREAQQASIAAVRPGVAAGAVDKAGRDVLKKAGYAAYFSHSTGHGVGMEVHEGPRLAKGQKQRLAPGMIITIEPGIYIPEEGGVRIEDMVLVTESGHEVLTPVTKDLIEL